MQLRARGQAPVQVLTDRAGTPVTVRGVGAVVGACVHLALTLLLGAQQPFVRSILTVLNAVAHSICLDTLGLIESGVTLEAGVRTTHYFRTVYLVRTIVTVFISVTPEGG